MSAQLSSLKSVFNSPTSFCTSLPECLIRMSQVTFKTTTDLSWCHYFLSHQQICSSFCLPSLSSYQFSSSSQLFRQNNKQNNDFFLKLTFRFILDLPLFHKTCSFVPLALVSKHIQYLTTSHPSPATTYSKPASFFAWIISGKFGLSTLVPCSLFSSQ